MRRFQAVRIEARQVLQRAPVAPPLERQFDDRLRDREADEPPVSPGRLHVRRLAVPRIGAQIDVVVQRYAVGAGCERLEVLLEAPFAQCEVGRRQRHVEQVHRAVVAFVLQRCGRPIALDVGVAFEREAFVERVAAPRVVDEDRIHAALDGQPRAAVRGLVADPVFGLTRRVDVQHGRAVVGTQQRNGVREEVVLQRGRRLDDQHARMERRDQSELFARFDLAGVRGPVTREIRILREEARRRGLSAGVGVRSRIEHDHLDRRGGREQPRERSEADVVGRAVAADPEHDRHERAFLG